MFEWTNVIIYLKGIFKTDWKQSNHHVVFPLAFLYSFLFIRNKGYLNTIVHVKSRQHQRYDVTVFLNNIPMFWNWVLFLHMVWDNERGRLLFLKIKRTEENTSCKTNKEKNIKTLELCPIFFLHFGNKYYCTFNQSAFVLSASLLFDDKLFLKELQVVFVMHARVLSWINTESDHACRRYVINLILLIIIKQKWDLL